MSKDILFPYFSSPYQKYKCFFLLVQLHINCRRKKINIAVKKKH
ncbi:hypothetical protein Smp_180970 [Schistosoma mansoni]|nr:hypothetical protein Smp_180970 [Schistosoma mansoni]|eukprot:XP_018650387.1 hypothetical protein Smp_180970 [Schistosoma mansoni]